jgi:hypothetical protein
MNTETPKRVTLVVVLLVGFLPLPFYLATDNLFTLLDAVAVSIGVTVIFSYLRGSLSWVWDRPKTTAGHLLVLGITATWLAAVGRLAWLWAWRLMGRPDEFFDHWFVAVTLYMFIIGGSLHLVANKAIDDRVPVGGWITLVVAVLVGLVMGVGLIHITGS